MAGPWGERGRALNRNIKQEVAPDALLHMPPTVTRTFHNELHANVRLSKQQNARKPLMSGPLKSLGCVKGLPLNLANTLPTGYLLFLPHYIRKEKQINVLKLVRAQ